MAGGVALDISPGSPLPARSDNGVAPATVSARRQLRHGLPEIYREGRDRNEREPNFTMRFLHALEEVLDPITATLDSLGPHLNADLAPGHALAGLATWLGVAEVESLSAVQRREALRRAGELGRRRGTRVGLELALNLFFPAIPMRIDDHGKALVVEEADDPTPPAAAASFDVYVDSPLPPEDQMAVARCIERWKPVHARYRLRVRKGETGETLPAPRPSSPILGLTPPDLQRPGGDDTEPRSQDP